MTDNLHLINRPTAAKLLGVSVETIEKIVAAGTLDEVRLHPTAWPRLRRADVEALARGEHPAKTESA
jgi:excisionase family DNA binding protein